jgi:hypothetical protein
MIGGSSAQVRESGSSPDVEPMQHGVFGHE